MDSNDDVVGVVKTRSKRITAGSLFSFNMSQTVEVEQPLPISWPFYGQVHFKRNLGRVKFLRKLKNNIHQLSLVYGDLSRKDAEIRLKLRCHRGHRGKVNNTVIVWLEQVERTAKKFNSITSQVRKTSRSKFYSLQILVVAKKVVKLIDEVKFLVESAASLIFFNDRNGAERGPGKLTSLVGQMAQKISSQIWTHLMDPSIRTICLYGLGGVGKTTMMRNTNSELASTAIFDEIVWATLSKNVNWEKVQDDIAQQLGIELPGTSQVEVRAKTIFEHVKSVERCLFIIDDVWESLAFDLETMGIPEGEHKGCKIVFTTRFLRVGRFMRVDKNIKLSPLSESEAWELFVSKSGNQVLNSDIQNTAKEVLIACLGLPITIITVGHAMRDKVSGTAWSSALRDLQSTQHETQRAVENLLRFGFRHLKNDQVRSCFSYCAFFPKDFKFEPKELIEYWMAEDFIRNKEGILRAIDNGFEILKDLKDANMLEILVEGGTEWLKMHDLFRDLAIAITTEEFDYLMKPGLKIKEFPRILEYVRAKKNLTN